MTGFLAQSAQITQFGVVAVGHLFDQGAQQIGGYTCAWVTEINYAS